MKISPYFCKYIKTAIQSPLFFSAKSFPHKKSQPQNILSKKIKLGRKKNLSEVSAKKHHQFLLSFRPKWLENKANEEICVMWDLYNLEKGKNTRRK